MWPYIIGFFALIVIIFVYFIFEYHRSDENQNTPLPFIVLNPYFGFGFRPGLTPRDFLKPESRIDELLYPNGSGSWLDIEANVLGFWSRYPIPYAPEKDELVIGVFGGSVAKWHSLQSGALLEDILSKALSRKVSVLTFAMGGMKQPQQAQIASYLFQTGHKIDLILNIDGLNEIIFNVGNKARNLETTWPSIHMLGLVNTAINSTVLDHNLLRAFLKISRIRRMSNTISSLKKRRPVALIRPFLTLLERRLTAHENTFRKLIESNQNNSDRNLIAFPKPFQPEADADPVEQWGRSSLFLNGLTSSLEKKYIHIQQPHFSWGQKTMTKEEEALISIGAKVASLASTHQSGLDLKAKELISKGVSFIDATHIFDAVNETVYCDSAGHLNQRGNDILAKFIATQIAPLLAKS